MITVTDLFSGAGGSTTGAIQVPGVHVRIAANHFQIVTDIHALNHPDTDHAVVDLHLERPQFFPKTDMLWASPECTKWSQANGAKMPAIDEGLFEDPLSDDAKTRSRLLMFDVLRFIEYHRYRLVIVENVVDIATQAQYRTAWTIWRAELRTLTTAGHQALLQAGTPTGRPKVSPADLKAAEEMVPEVLFRMFQPHEVAAGMAFPADYKWQPPDRNKPISNRDLVKAAGNAVTPPSARDLVAVCVESLGYDVERAA